MAEGTHVAAHNVPLSVLQQRKGVLQDKGLVANGTLWVGRNCRSARHHDALDRLPSDHFRVLWRSHPLRRCSRAGGHRDRCLRRLLDFFLSDHAHVKRRDRDTSPTAETDPQTFLDLLGPATTPMHGSGGMPRAAA